MDLFIDCRAVEHCDIPQLCDERGEEAARSVSTPATLEPFARGVQLAEFTNNNLLNCDT